MNKERLNELQRVTGKLVPEAMDEHIGDLESTETELLPREMLLTVLDENRVPEDRKLPLLDALDEFSWSLAVCSAKIIRYRAGFARRLREAAGPIQREFSAGAEELDLSYATVSTVEDPAASEKELFEAVWRRQTQLRQAELDAGSCLVGAHKDDLAFTINGADARSYASQGQARTAALSVKLAEREIFLSETGEVPVLLLDDVLSELDAARQEFVLNRIGGGQTLVTCCEADSVSRLLDGRVLTMEKGRVTG